MLSFIGWLFVVNGFAPIFPDTCYHLTHYWPAAAGILSESDIPARWAGGFIVMRERCCKVSQCCSHIRFWHERDIVFLHRFHEPFGHAITLRAAHRRCAGLQIQLSGEPPCFMCGMCHFNNLLFNAGFSGFIRVSELENTFT